MLELDDQASLRRLKSVFSTDRAILSERYSPYFCTYFREFFDEDFRHYLRKIQDIMEAADINQNHAVVDLGCDFGVMAALIRLSGAREVVGIELNAGKVQVANQIIQDVGASRIQIQVGAITKTDLPSDRFDVAIANEVISHVSDLERMLRESHRILKPGGRFYIVDSDSLLNLPSHFNKARRRNCLERGPCEYHTPYLAMRRQVIRERFSDIAEEEVQRIAERTHGLWGTEITEVAQRILKGQMVTAMPEGIVRDPETGEYEEHELNPYQVRRLLKDVGFNAQILRPHFRPQTLTKKAVAWLLEATHPVSLLVAPSYTIRAVKVA